VEKFNEMIKRLCRHELTPFWHKMVAFVLIFYSIQMTATLFIPRSQRLKESGHSVLEGFYLISPLLIGVIAILIFLPKTGNESASGIWRSAGRIWIPIRYLIMNAFVAGVYGLGLAVEKWIT
jgi:hypothetical protein